MDLLLLRLEPGDVIVRDDRPRGVRDEGRRGVRAGVHGRYFFEDRARLWVEQHVRLGLEEPAVDGA